MGLKPRQNFLDLVNLKNERYLSFRTRKKINEKIKSKSSISLYYNVIQWLNLRFRFNNLDQRLKAKMRKSKTKKNDK